MGVIESTKHSSGEFISKIFLRPKKQKGKFRLILDLKSLNDDVQYHHFKMDTLETILKLVNKDAYMLSLDLQDAYYSLKIQLGLHDIGKWNDIDIGVQYCDIDITHDIYAYTCSSC